MDADDISVSINTFAVRSFRDVADQDYILARIAFRDHLYLQFVWLAQQATEKYLKAILLFNRRSSKNLGHDVSAALRAVRAIDDIPFEFPPVVDQFLEYLDRHANRYFEYPFYVQGEHLVELDETVWHLRRWCDYVRGTTTVGAGSVEVENLPFEIERRRLDVWKGKPHQFRLFGGFLETVLEKRRYPRLRPALIWNNMFYTLRQRQSCRIRQSFAANSVLSMHPQALEHLEPLVHLSKDVKFNVERWSV